VAEVYWVDAFGGRSLAIVGRPRPEDWLADDVAAWQTAGVRAVVSMLTAVEIQELGLSGEADACHDNGIAYYSFPIADRSIPESTTEFERLIGSLLESIDAGQPVAVHCRAGIGRSAILAAGMMVRRGETPDSALRRIEAARGLPVPDTDEQRDWLIQFALRGPHSSTG
jgi:protein-tyrosine phosphatase